MKNARLKNNRLTGELAKNPAKAGFHQHAANIAMLEQGNSGRKQAEAFVSNGFAVNHDAIIRNFMPYLVALGAPDIEAVIGIRPATEQLFLEQYLDHPIETLMEDASLQRAQIAEVGNLVSDNRHFTLTAFMIVTAALHRAGFKQMVFCATAQVAAILRRVGADLCPIVEADGRRIGDSLAEWGRYYDHAPTIMRLDLAPAAALIESSPLLRRYCQPYQAEIDNIAQRLRSPDNATCKAI